MIVAVQVVTRISAIRFLRLGCLALGVLLANQAWADKCQLGRYGTLPVELEGSRATTIVKINGNDTRFALDTGSFYNIMSNASAASLGLKLRPMPFNFRISGIGGSTGVQYTRVKQFGILGTTIDDVDFLVGGTDSGYGLLGANLLDFADLEIDMAHGKFSLFKVDGCGKASLAYWSNGHDYFMADLDPSDSRTDRRTFIDVTINGKKVRALIDSGATVTLLSRHAAERAGLDVNAPGVKKAPRTGGFGSKSLAAWIVPVDSFSVGTETIQHSQVEVIDGNLGSDNTDMLLGLDYLLAHHMFIANSQGKAYFTYNGSRLFAYANASDNDSSHANTADNSGAAAPKTASDYALRGDADLSRGQPQDAITDLNEAIRQAPDQADYYASRAKAYWTVRQSDAALTDLNKALSLDPKNLDALLLRARLHFSHKDLASAETDMTAASPLVPAGSTQARSIASMYIELGQPGQALPFLDDWIRLHDNDVNLGSALNERCWARALSNQMLDDALSDCRKAIKRNGEVPAYLDSLGLVQLRLGNYSESIKAYQQAVAKLSRSAWTRYGLGVAEIRNGQTDAGNADLAAARAIDSHIDARAGKFGLTAKGS
jgi:clan AA aspartic protease (TIGR02281 family)